MIGTRCSNASSGYVVCELGSLHALFVSFIRHVINQLSSSINQARRNRKEENTAANISPYWQRAYRNSHNRFAAQICVNNSREGKKNTRKSSQLSNAIDRLISRASSRRRSRSRSRLDDLLHSLLDLVPVVRVNPRDLGLEVFLNLRQHLPLALVRDEGHSDTDATETTGTADTMEVGLEIGLPIAGAGPMHFGDVLLVILARSIQGITKRDIRS